MTQEALETAVAEATGESMRTITRRGFSLADPVEVCFDPEPYESVPQYLDWDALEAQWREPLP